MANSQAPIEILFWIIIITLTMVACVLGLALLVSYLVGYFFVESFWARLGSLLIYLSIGAVGFKIWHTKVWGGH